MKAMKMPHGRVHALTPVTEATEMEPLIMSSKMMSNMAAASAACCGQPGGNRASCSEPLKAKSAKDTVMTASAVTVPSTCSDEVSSYATMLLFTWDRS